MEADDPTVELIAPDGPAVPSRPSGGWAPGLAASTLFGPRALRRTPQVAPQARSRPLLRDLVVADEETSESCRRRWQAGPRSLSASSGLSTLLAFGLLVLLACWPSRRAVEQAGPPTEPTELVMECTKVACMGASITRGNVVVLGGELASNAPYPTQLQDLLGPGYCVTNFGVPGSTVLKKSRRPFWEQPEMKRVSDFLPDIVVIQFGANDSREKNFDTDFRGDYASMIAFMRSLPSRPKVYIMAMPPIYPGTASKDGIPGKKYGMDAERLDVLRVPLNLIAKENGLSPPITVLNAFKKHCPHMDAKCDWMSGDGVHPNAHGDAAMARLVHLTVAGDNLCTAQSSDKEPCGDAFNASEASCKELGCCWTPDSAGAPWCFKRVPAKRALPEECLARHDEKTDCGFQGETMAECEARGCCYKPSLDGTPWCFHRLQPSRPPGPPVAEYASRVTSTSWSTSVTATTTTATTTLTRTSTSTTHTSTTSTNTATTPAAVFQATPLPIWLLVGGLALLALGPLGWLLTRQCCPPKEEKQQSEKPPGLDAHKLNKVKEDEERELRRVQAERAFRSAEKKREEKERFKSTRELLSMLSEAGFTGINEPKTKRTMLRTSFSYPLHAAVEANSPEAIRLLLQARADASVEDSRKRTPLALAMQLNKRDSHAEAVAVLSAELGPV